MNIKDCIEYFKSDDVVETFNTLYGKKESIAVSQKKRYIRAIQSFCDYFPDREEIHIFSAPGRTEIGGNHTDHQRGAVLAGAVDLDAIAVVAFHGEKVVRVKSEGYMISEIKLDHLQPDKADEGTTALTKGVLAIFAEKGIVVSGIDMYITSNVICGSGISSSAAFETLIGTIIDHQYNNSRSSAFEIARCGWYAENVYFGKKCGLLDQTVSSYGGLVSIDFKDENAPEIEKIEFDFEEYGYTLCITDTKSSHANLTGDYVAIRDEMRQVAKYFDRNVLSEVDEKMFYSVLPNMRSVCTDRAILRAMHFFGETKRAKEEAKALKNRDIHQFLKLVNESGESSGNLLQNLYSTKTPTQQSIPLALAVSKHILGDKGAVRVHGGGFAGTIQGFVPEELLSEYRIGMERIFGDGTCHFMKIRPVGGIKII